MRDLFRAIAHVERTLARDLDRSTTVPKEKQRPPSPKAWRAPASETRYPEQAINRKNKPMAKLTTRASKVVATLDATAVATLPTSDGQARSDLIIDCEGK